MLTRVFGRKKYGKTEYCIDVLKKCVLEQKRCYLIVPEQFTFSCEKRMTDELGNRANLFAEVLSFTRLCTRVFRRFGGVSGGFLDSVGKLLCMSKAMRAVSGALCEYGGAFSDVSFAACAVRMAEEFSAYRITSDAIDRALNALSGHDDALGGKLRDVSLISAAYRAELKNSYGTDGENLDRLNSVLSEHDFFGKSTVIIDSFYGFTPQELRIVSHMLRQADDVYITFCTQKGDADPVFRRPVEASNAIFDLSAQIGLPVRDVILPAPPYHDGISRIERSFCAETCLYGGTPDTCGEDDDGGDNVEIIRCKNQIDEAKAVAARIHALVSDGKTHYRDIAVCARSAASYEGVIDVFFEKAGIPFTFSVREDLLTKPIIAYVLTAAEFISSWRQKSFLCLIKTGLMRLSAEQCALLENYIRTWNINGKKEFCTEWYMNPSGYSADFTEKDAKILDEVNAAKETVMTAVMKFYEDAAQANGCREMARAVYGLMCDSAYAAQLENDDDVRFWNLTVRAIDEIVKVYGDEEMTVASFCALFQTAVTEYGVQNIPETLDCVLIGAVDLIRSETVKYMFVLGCNNEYFPMQTVENEIFSDQEKTALARVGINVSSPAKDGAYDEFFLAYNIFCDPYQKLFLLYSERDTGGKDLKKSVLLSAVERLFPTLSEQTYPFCDPLGCITTPGALADDLYSIGDAAGSEAFMRAAKRVLSEDDGAVQQDTKNGSETGSIGENENENENEKEKFRALFAEKSPQEEREGMLSAETADAFFGDTVCASPSRFECYSSCRFHYFNRYVLKIFPEKKAELDSLQTGLVSHKILEYFVRELAESKRSGCLFSKEHAKNRIRSLLEIHFEKITHTRGTARTDAISKRFRYLYNRLSGILTELAEHLVDELEQSEFFPADFEVNIGISDDAIRSVPIEMKGPDGASAGNLHIVGQVDRADIYRKDGKTYVRIIDYKTGPKSFQKDAVAYGFQLQMLLYLYCISQSETKKYGENPVPAGVLYIPVRKPDVQDTVLADSTEEKYGKIMPAAFRGDGILIDDREVLCAMDRDLSGRFIPVTLTKDGVYSAYSKVDSLENLGKLLEKAAAVSGQLAYLMRTGNIQTNPYRNELSSCAKCEYGAVCRIDRKNKNIRYSLEEVK